MELNYKTRKEKEIMKDLTITQIPLITCSLGNPYNHGLGCVKKYGALIPLHKELSEKDKNQEWEIEFRFFKVVSYEADQSEYSCIQGLTWQYLGKNYIQQL